ncbi:MAG: putative ABC transporter permease [Oscillospiraceae bacterium]
MLSYSVSQWILFFFVYCFIGWIIESVIVSADEKKLVNRGFLRIPMLPLYGLGAIAMLFAVLPVRENPTLVFICGALSATLLEYITGVLMELLFKVKYWDYSQLEYNINGRVCLLTSLFWGFLSLLLTFQLHAFVEELVLGLSSHAIIVADIIIGTIFVSDVIYSVKSAIDLKNILARLTELKAELGILISQKAEESERAQIVISKIASLKTERQKLLLRINYYIKSIVKAHPRATSSKFNDALKEIRAAFENRKNRPR